MTYDELTFRSGGVECSAWLFHAADDRLANDVGRPVVVMAHGLGGTKDSGLESFATALAGAGLDVLAFDYRGFGASGGTPRQIVSMAGQLADYRAAMSTAAGLPGADPDRLVLWGESLSAGTVIAAAAGRADVAAIITMVPMVDGLAASRHAMSSYGVGDLARTSARSIAATFSRDRTATMPLVSNTGQVAALSAPGYYEAYLSIAGPTWRNEIGARLGSEIATFRPSRLAGQLRCHWLAQIADFDRAAPPYSAAKAAFKGRAEVRHYPCDHFGTQVGQEWHEPAVAHQVAFLSRHLAPKSA